MKYAAQNGNGKVVSIFEADSLAEAVAIKHHIQQSLKEMHGIDEILSIAQATPKDRADFKYP